ncbi:oxygen-independent coproporphyrinogen III oxidase [Microvirga flavescens]|uniref:oxygen-independent coproporphyrinogen III oxidase n=1 Tax=Microvirga flavescens TaxID=2249811 RepID=UPI000DD686F9|nr:oxygen-independent coproporphyrinogen III oxidase [Microvirga flavescens]
MTNNLVSRYGGLPVPRYTSYPTAAEFSPSVGPTDYGNWLSRIDAKESVSVYLHVPFCRDLCHYCGCHTKMARRDDVIASYRESLEAEIVLAGAQFPSQLKLARLHWGGGTPSIVGAEGMASIVDVLKRYFVFEPDCEHAVELDPRYVDDAFARKLVALGVNRVSLGVQDLDPAVQVAIGRVQPQAVVETAVNALRAAGLEHINFDLMYGLPLQTEESVRRTCAAVAALSPERIACYGYAHMPSRKRHQRLIDEETLPDVAERFRQSRVVAETFLAHGYVSIGIDHFARPDDPLALAAKEGRLHRNFQGYTDDDRPILIGFGASAISRLANGFAQNVPDISTYQRIVAEGILPTARGCRFTDRDRTRSEIIEQLMCNFRADLASLDGPEEFADELAFLRPLIVDGIVTVQDHRVTVTEQGKPFVRLVAAVFDQYREEEPKRFSKAI